VLSQVIVIKTNLRSVYNWFICTICNDMTVGTRVTWLDASMIVTSLCLAIISDVHISQWNDSWCFHLCFVIVACSICIFIASIGLIWSWLWWRIDSFQRWVKICFLLLWKLLWIVWTNVWLCSTERDIMKQKVQEGVGGMLAGYGAVRWQVQVSTSCHILTYLFLL